MTLSPPRPDLHASDQQVQSYFNNQGYDITVMELAASTRTAEEAADAMTDGLWLDCAEDQAESAAHGAILLPGFLPQYQQYIDFVL